MTNQIAGKEREHVWTTLAELFVDSKVDYAYCAEKLRGYPTDELKDIFFSEVAPVCGPNLLSPVPPIWSGFNDEWVVSEIHRRRQRQQSSLVFRMSHRALVLYLRLRLGAVWSEIERAILLQQDTA